MSNPITTATDKVRVELGTQNRSEAKATPTEVKDSISAKSDEVTLSAAVEAALDKAEFDSQKVEQIKKMLADGEYPLDSKKIAESFHALEQLITDPS